jgi:peroxiredoxin
MSAPRVGDLAPEIVLSDSTGEKRTLSSLTPFVLIFYRGHW